MVECYSGLYEEGEVEHINEEKVNVDRLRKLFIGGPRPHPPEEIQPMSFKLAVQE